MSSQKEKGKLTNVVEQVSELRDLLKRYIELVEQLGFPDSIEKFIDKMEKMIKFTKELRTQLEELKVE